MKNMYAISLGLTASGVACTWADAIGPVDASFELTGIGYLLGSAGLILLVICLGASLEDCLRSPWRRVSRPIGSQRRRR